MKKVLSLVVLSVLFSFNAFAQPRAGSVMLGGSVSFTSLKYEGADESNTSYSISPSFGYFVNDKVALGVDLSFEKGTMDIETDFGVFSLEQETRAFGPFARFYVPLSSENFSFYMQGGVRIGKSEITDSGETLGELELTNVYFSPGFTYFFNKTWALDLELQGFQYTKIKDESTEISLGADFFTPSLGIRIFLGGE